MEQLSERLQTPISTAELERRWAAVRAAMERDKFVARLFVDNLGRFLDGAPLKEIVDRAAGY